MLLDRTPFYPEGGGQPCDLGAIAGVPVTSVVEQDGEPVHFLAGNPASLTEAGIVPGAMVRCQLDGERRRDHTEQHTAQHLLSAIVLRLLGAPTRSFHLGERYSSIDVDIPFMDRAGSDVVEATVLEVIRDGYPIITHLCPPENPDSFPLRRKPPADAEVLRILEIDGIDYTPCAGTHLCNTGAIHAFRILKTEKYKGMTRIYFLAGGRAQSDHRKLATLIRDAAGSAGCAEDDVSRVMATLMDRNAILESELTAGLEQIAAFEVQALLATLPGTAASAEPLETASPNGMTGVNVMKLGPDAGILAGFVLIQCAHRQYPDVARLAKAGAERKHDTIAVSFADNKIAAASAAIDGGPRDIGRLLKPLVQNYGGKGGGSSFFHAAFPGCHELAAFIKALGGTGP